MNKNMKSTHCPSACEMHVCFLGHVAALASDSEQLLRME